jgi:hypothetical protein
MRSPVRGLGIASASVVLVMAGATSATAVEGSYYSSTSVGSGWGSASTYVSGGANKWSVSAYVKDNRSGDDCTKAEIRVAYYNGSVPIVASRQVCGASSTSFSASGQIYITNASDAKYVYLQVCQNRTGVPDSCSQTTRVYLQ